MKSGWWVVLAAMLMVVTVGCATKKSEVKKDAGKDDLSQYQRLDEERYKYNPYLLRMTDDERARFFKLENDHDRDLFLKSEGITDKKFLYDNLRIGMNKPAVREKLGPPNYSVVDFNDDGKETRWLFSRFNGTRYSHYALVFKEEKLVSWDVWVGD